MPQLNPHGHGLGQSGEIRVQFAQFLVHLLGKLQVASLNRATLLGEPHFPEEAVQVVIPTLFWKFSGIDGIGLERIAEKWVENGDSAHRVLPDINLAT